MKKNEIVDVEATIKKWLVDEPVVQHIVNNEVTSSTSSSVGNSTTGGNDPLGDLGLSLSGVNSVVFWGTIMIGGFITVTAFFRWRLI